MENGKKIVMKSLHFLFVGCVVIAASVLRANPVGVTYTVSGSAGDYVLDFTVTNNMPAANANQVDYFFGVDVSGGTISATPTGGWSARGGTWDPYPNGGGPNEVYNDNWIGGSIADGTSVSGFDVTVTSATAPTSVDWFAYTSGGSTYTGSDNFKGYPTTNPGFAGTATEAGGSVTDTGSTAAMLAAGLLLISGAARRRLLA